MDRTTIAASAERGRSPRLTGECVEAAREFTDMVVGRRARADRLILEYFSSR
jgi:hypothetical protein